jgi:hypothetical protein
LIKRTDVVKMTMRNNDHILSIPIRIQRLIGILGDGKGLYEIPQRRQIRLGVSRGTATARVKENQDMAVQLDIYERNFGPFIILYDDKGRWVQPRASETW